MKKERLFHRLEDEAVLLGFRVSSSQPAVVKVTQSEAKRFAWAILADLDPEEAQTAGSPLSEPVPRARGTAHARERTAFATQPRAILAFLRNGKADTRRIAVAVDISTQQAAVVLCNMAKRGLVTRLTRGLAGYPAIWQAGPTTIEAYEAAKRAGCANA